MNNIREMAHNLQAETIAFRRDLHKNPEPSMEEFRTTDKVAAALDAMGVSYRRLDPTGVIAEVNPGENRLRVQEHQRRHHARLWP